MCWSLVGLGTGHMYVQYWRAPPAHFTGWAAFALCAAVTLLAVALVVRLWHGVSAARILASYLLAASALMAVLAIGLKLGRGAALQDGASGFSGLLTDGALRNALGHHATADFAARHMAGVFTWLKISCGGLIVVALACKLLGVTKQTLSDHPAFTAILFIVFGSPFLAWISLELMDHAFRQLGLSGEAGAVWRAKVSYALSMLVVVAGISLFTAVAALALVLQVFGVRVVWKAEHASYDPHDAGKAERPDIYGHRRVR